MKKTLFLLLLFPTMVMAIATGDTTHHLELITSKLSNQKIAITPTGTGTVELNVGISGTAFLDEDTLSSNSATKLASQQSIKAYVDNSPPSFTTVTKTTTATLAITGEDLVVVDAASGDFTVTLPSAVGNSGVRYTITKSTEANTVTIDADGSELIGSELNAIMESIDDKIVIYSDNVKWQFEVNEIVYSATYHSVNGLPSLTNSGTTLMEYEVKDHDTHDMCNTSGTCTIPVAGKWRATCTIQTLGSWAATEFALMKMEKNTTIISENSWESAATSTSQAIAHWVGTESDFAKDDTVKCFLFQNSGANVAPATDLGRNVLTLIRIK